MSSETAIADNLLSFRERALDLILPQFGYRIPNHLVRKKVKTILIELSLHPREHNKLEAVQHRKTTTLN